MLLLSWLLVGGSAHAARRSHKGAVITPLRLKPDPGIPLQVHGLHGYFGTISLRSASDGIVVVDSLPLERYLLGLNEVPTDWPEEALRAQAIAARTYALWTLEQPPGGSAATYGFDICASTSCQVFSGADVVRLSSHGERWASAVADTEGIAVLYRGEPILARYHSTSGGMTLDNEDVFPSEGPFPYLKGVESTTEKGSSLYRWVVRFPRRDAEAILRRAGLWGSGNGRLVSVRTIASADDRHYPDLIFKGTKGRLRISTEGFRVPARTLAPEMFPGRYPSRAGTAFGRLPETFPSNRFTAYMKHKKIVIVGRGWGHGVGMSQWGAEGLARHGSSAVEILTHYYTGVDVAPYPDPGTIDVGVAYGSQSVTVTGAFDLVNGNGRTIVDGAVGRWRFTFAGAGAVTVDPPRGFGLPLEIGVVKVPAYVLPGESIVLPIALSAPAAVRTWTEGQPDHPPPVVPSAGRTRIDWTAPDEPGTYTVRVVATSQKQRSSDKVSIVVAEQTEATAAPPAASPSRSEGWGAGRWALIGAGLALGLAAAIFIARKVTMGT